jgi:IclR family acetate operon transcriptional repressor
VKNRSKTQKSEVSTSIRVFDILELVAEADSFTGLSLSEISNSLDTSKSTIHRHLQTLEKLHIVERKRGDSYHLGWKILSLAGKYLENLRFPIIAEPFMHQLSETTQEAVHIAVPADNEVIYVGKVDSPKSIVMTATIGGRLPLHSTSLGKSVLANLPEQKREEVIALGLPAMTANTITSPENLRAHLDQVRSQGFAVNNMEYEDGVRSVGAPVFDYTQAVIGAVSVAAPNNRIPLEDVKTIGSIVKETALAISRRMGYPR